LIVGEIEPGTVLENLRESDKTLQDEVQKQLLKRLQEKKTQHDAQLEESGLVEIRTELGQRIDAIEARIAELQGANHGDPKP
jgi:hypothetical protein